MHVGLAMDAPWFHDALHRAGVTQADLARHLRLAPSAVSRIFKGERKIKLLEAAQIAAFLGVSQEEVLAHAGDTEAAKADPEPRRGRPPVARPAPLLEKPRATMADLIPIRSAGRGGEGQEMYVADGTLGYTRRPVNLIGIRNAYAVYMVGDSMEPRYEQGWLLHVNPFKPAIRGRDVVVYKRDNSVLIKQFIGLAGDKILLRQLNPAKEFEVPQKDVAEYHLIVGVDQEG